MKTEESKAELSLITTLAGIMLILMLGLSLVHAAGPDITNGKIGTNLTYKSTAAADQHQTNWDGVATDPYAHRSMVNSTAAVLQAQITAGSGGISSNDVVIIAHRVASGSSGGSTTNAGGANVRPFNVKLYDPGAHCVLMTNNNTWSLNTGTYIFEYWSVVYGASIQQTSKIRDITAGADLPDGEGSVTDTGAVTGQQLGYGRGIINVTGSTNVYQLQHYVSATNLVGWGNGYGFGISNCFAKMRFIKIR